MAVVNEPVFSGRCARCGLGLTLDDEFSTVEQFSAMWKAVHACTGTVVPKAAPLVGSFEQAAAKHNADTIAFVASGTRVDAVCPECARLPGVKSKKGFPPKFWPNKNGGPDQCDGIDSQGVYLNHRRKPVTA